MIFQDFKLILSWFSDFEQIMSDFKISRREAQLRYPDGEVKPYSIIASQSTVF